MVGRNAWCISKHHYRTSPSLVEWSLSIPMLVTFICVSKFIWSQVRFILKLMRYELDDYNDGERLRERLEWCQEVLEIDGSMVVVVYVDDKGSGHFLGDLLLKQCRGCIRHELRHRIDESWLFKVFSKFSRINNSNCPNTFQQE